MRCDPILCPCTYTGIFELFHIWKCQFNTEKFTAEKTPCPHKNQNKVKDVRSLYKFVTKDDVFMEMINQD